NGEDAPLLRTTVDLPAGGTYDLWVNFWALPGSDWRVRAGLSEDTMQTFRQVKSASVDPASHPAGIATSGPGGVRLYQAYVGRMSGGSVEVFVDDDALRTGASSGTSGDTVRTVYDGISYAAAGGGGDAFRSWMLAHGASGGPADDSDGDGFANAVEFVLGGNPALGDAGAIAPRVALQADGAVTVRLRRTDASLAA